VSGGGLFACLAFALTVGCAGAAAPDAASDASPSDALDAASDAASDAARDASVPDVPDAADAASDAGDQDATGADAAATSEEPWFEDVTERAGLGFERVAAEGWASLPDRMGGGVCVLDADGEGPFDLFFAMRPAGGSRLFAASTPLAYEDRTDALGLRGVGDALGCLAFDADADGDDDLLVTGLGTLELWLQQEGGFARADVLPSVDARTLRMSAAAADLDDDGDLDLLVAGFVELHPDFAPDPDTCVAEACAANIATWPPARNLLLLRDEAGRYHDAAETLAPALAVAEPTLVVTATDLDDDGHVDIFVGNDLGRTGVPDRVLRHDADGVYRDAPSLGLGRKGSGLSTCTMGVAHGDLDGNGRTDTLTTSFERDPSALYLCFADEPCEERGEAWGMGEAEGSFRWGAALADFDADGWLDVIESTGHLVTEGELAAAGLSGGPLAQRPNFYINEAGTGMRLLSPAATDGLSQSHQTRGLAVVDLDDDGRLDVVLAPNQGRPAALRNLRSSGHWLRVRLVGAALNSGGIGATVTVETAAGRWRRQKRAGEGYLGSFDPRLHFGLPTDAPARVRVDWPDGATTTVPSVAVDREVSIRR